MLCVVFIVIACWEIGVVFIFYVGFVRLFPFLFQNCVDGEFIMTNVSVPLTINL
jgi:hypothetical protein